MKKINIYALALCLCSPGGWAADLGKKKEVNTKRVKILSKLSLSELFDVKVKIASGNVETLSEAPSLVTVFTGKELRAMGIQSLEELLNYIPGFQSMREVAGGDGFVANGRGYSTAQTGYNILFMIDGQRINNDISGGALMPNRFISTANIKQVEVIRGPGSALYGTSAFTGVVNVITDKELNNITLSKGNLGSHRLSANLSGKNDYGQAAVYFHQFQQQGQAYEAKLTEVLNPSVSGITDPRRGQDFQVSYQWQDKLKLSLRHTQRDVDDFFIRDYPHADNYHHTEQNYLHFDYQLHSDKTWDFNVTGGYLTTKQQRRNDAFDRQRNDTIRFEEQEWRLGMNLHYRYGKHRLLAGADLRRPQVDTGRKDIANYDGTRNDDVSLLTESHRNIIGIYLQDQYRFNKTYSVTAGVRYDDYSDSGGNLNPRLALVYRPHRNTSFKLLYGEAFRAPSIRQTQSTNGLGNPDLNPEKIKTFELAWTQKYKKSQTTLNYFYNQVNDRIDTVNVSVNGRSLRQFSNTDTVKTSGFELESKLDLGNWKLRAAYTFLTKHEQAPRRIARQTLALISDYQRGDWHWNVSGVYHGSREHEYLINRQSSFVPLASYWLLNSRLSYQVNKGLSVFVQGQNLLDETYYTPVKATDFSQGIINRGRTVQLGVTLNF